MQRNLLRENLKICKATGSSLKILLGLHPAFHHEASQESSHFLVFSGNISNFVKLNYCTVLLPSTLSQSSVLNPANQDWSPLTGWQGELRLEERYFPDVSKITVTRSCRPFCRRTQESAVKALFKSILMFMCVSRDCEKLQKSKQAVHHIQKGRPELISARLKSLQTIT